MLEKSLLEELPYEILLSIAVYTPGPALKILTTADQVFSELLEDQEFRRRWLQNYGKINWNRLVVEPCERVRLIHLAFTISTSWAEAIYSGLPMFTRISVIKGLLGNQEYWNTARFFGILEKRTDDEMEDKSYGIYYRHLKWRFQQANLLIAD